MTQCRRISPNCIWQVPSEWHSLNYYSALLTRLYRNCSTNIVWVCVTPFHPMTSKLNIQRKANKRVHFGFRAMASLYELSCHHSRTCSKPLNEESLSYLATRFSSHVLDYIFCESSGNELVNSIDYSISAFPSDDSNYFSQNLSFFNSNFLLQEHKNTYHKRWTPDSKKLAAGHERPTTKKMGLEAPQLQETAGVSY